MNATRARLAITAGVGGIAVLMALVAGAAAVAKPQTVVHIEIRHSRFVPAEITVPVGVPVTITLRNSDPIDHEWIVGDDQLHARHRVGTEPLHAGRPTEVPLPAMSTVTTVVVFERTGSLAFICHLPAHERYGMVGTVTIR